MEIVTAAADCGLFGRTSSILQQDGVLFRMPWTVKRSFGRARTTRITYRYGRTAHVQVLMGENMFHGHSDGGPTRVILCDALRTRWSTRRIRKTDPDYRIPT